MSQAVAGMQTEQAFVNIFTKFVRKSRIVAQPKTGWTNWRTSIAALRVHTTLAYAASRYSIGTFIDICDKLSK